MSYDEIQLKVLRYFREFGQEVGEVIFTELCRPEGLPGLLQRMGVDPEGDSANQYKMLLQFLRYHGGEMIFKFIPPSGGVAKKTNQNNPIMNDQNLSSSAQDSVGPVSIHGVRPVTNDELSLSKVIEDIHNPEESVNKMELPPVIDQFPVKKKKISEAPIPHLQRKAEANQKPLQVKEVIKKEDSSSGQPEPEKTEKAFVFPSGPLKPGPSPTTAEGQEDWLSWDGNKPYDPKGTWPEVERRSGRERRKSLDRRNSVEIIYKNKRFGRDRRSDEEPRKNWPKDGHQ
jgi:hypothetical protein